MQGVFDPGVIAAFTANPSNPFIVSFPRTGSHWLRMLMELYFGEPILTRKFFLIDSEDYMALHTHDDDLNIARENVIYLWRDPVDTVYSQLVYMCEAVNNTESIERWADAYGKHLDKWIITETFTKKKTVLKYAELVRDATSVLRKVSEHFGVVFNSEKAWAATQRVTKAEVKNRTKYDVNVMRLGEEHARGRIKFRLHFSAPVWRALLKGREELALYLAKECNE